MTPYSGTLLGGSADRAACSVRRTSRPSSDGSSLKSSCPNLTSLAEGLATSGASTPGPYTNASGPGTGLCAKSLNWLTEQPPIDEQNDTLLIGAFELPLKVMKNGNGELVVERQRSLLLPLLHGLRNNVRVPVKFLGWAGYFPENEHEQILIDQLLAQHDCVPIHLSRQQLAAFSNFCHSILRPLFHNIVALEAISHEPFSEHEWQMYQAVNRLFADTIVYHAQETDLIWIHDFYLLLCPQYITKRIRSANVGLFVHTPFPSSEVFRCLPVREEILRGMLCADLIGFHFFEYARNFLVAIKRLLGLEHHFRMGGYVALDYAGREVMLKIGHAHIQYDELRRVVEQQYSIAEMASQLRCKHQDQFLFVAVDRCERLAGILLKLRGFQFFLRNYAYAQRKAVLVIYTYPTLHAWEAPAEYARELTATVDSINKEFSSAGRPVIFLQIQPVSADEKYALFQAADCFLDTAVRDGLNLNPFEYICCRKDDPSPLILSEFTGCSSSLASAIRVNPWKISDIAQAMDRAINTPAEELRVRFMRDQLLLQQNSTVQWTDDFLLDLRRARKRDDMVYISWGFGKSYRMVGLDRHFRYLDTDMVVYAFRRAKQALFFFDHEGTLAADKRRITAVPGYEALSGTGTAPSTRVLGCLHALLKDGHCVVIMSGRDRRSLDSWFGTLPDVGLCAEHGYYYKVPALGPMERDEAGRYTPDQASSSERAAADVTPEGTGQNNNNWKCVTNESEQDFTWKDIALELMKQYVKRTQGAFIENKGSALVFQYRDADPDFGSWQAKELHNYLEELLFSFPVTVMTGKGYVEVKLKGVSKGAAVKLLLDQISAKLQSENRPPLDFVLCIGDDRSDEEMFPVVNEFFKSRSAKDVPPAVGGIATDIDDTARATGAAGAVDAVNANLGSSHNSSLTLKYPRSRERFALLGGGLRAPKSCLSGLNTQIEDPLMQRRRNSSGADRIGILPVAHTVTVGKKPSAAKFYLNDVEDVTELLSSLTRRDY